MRLCIVACMLSAAVLSLSGCGVVPPQVKYQEYSQSVSFGYPFRQKRIVILVKYDSAKGAFEAHAAPTELDKDGKWMPLHLVSGVEDWKALTQLKVTYINDTKFVDVVNVTTKDKVADTIKNITDVAVAAAPVFGSVVAATANTPTIVFSDTTFDPESQKGTEWQKDVINPNYCLRIVETAVEQGITLTEYLGSRKSTAADFPVSSCASGVLEIAACTNASQVNEQSTKRIRVNYSAQDRVTPMALPSSGMLKMSSSCGASVTEADNQDRRQLTNYITSLIEGVKKVEAAKKK